jgi:hypothetical protein
MDASKFWDLATNYTAAWCSQRAERVASFFAADGSLKINDGAPTLTGTNTGPGGTGKAVRISGYEEWTLGADGLIATSLGHFDEAEYQRQLKEGVVSSDE